LDTGFLSLRDRQHLHSSSAGQAGRANSEWIPSFLFRGM
jgi:hypothetical protein